MSSSIILLSESFVIFKFGISVRCESGFDQSVQFRKQRNQHVLQLLYLILFCILQWQCTKIIQKRYFYHSYFILIFYLWNRQKNPLSKKSQNNAILYQHKNLSGVCMGRIQIQQVYQLKFIANKIVLYIFQITQSSNKHQMSSVSSSMAETQSNIKLEKHQLHMLTNNNGKFLSILANLKLLARAKIEKQIINQALIYLEEAEKILEYAASSGKNIDRFLIIEVLHNQAYCYQKNWELEKCSNYLKAIIYNIQSKDQEQVQSQSQLNSNITIGSCSAFYSKGLTSTWSWKERMQLAQYKIQHCAIESQLGHHKISIQSAQSAVRLIKSVVSELDISRKKHFKNIKNIKNGSDYFLNEPFQNFQAKTKIIQGLNSINDTILIQKLEGYQEAAKFYLNCWRLKKQGKIFNSYSNSIEELSIAKFTHLQPLSQSDVIDRRSQCQIWKKRHRNEVTQKEIFLMQDLQFILKMVALLSVAYFSIGTELRILNAKKHKYNSVLSSHSNELKQSQIYTLGSIIVLCIYFSLEIVLIEHLVSNYNTHYNNKLCSSINKEIQIELIKQKFDKFNFCKQSSKQQKKSRKNQINQQQKTLIVSSSSLQDQPKSKSKVKNKKMKKLTETTGSKSTINSKKSKSSSKIIGSSQKIPKNQLQRCRSELLQQVLNKKKIKKNKSQEKQSKPKSKSKSKSKQKTKDKDRFKIVTKQKIHSNNVRSASNSPKKSKSSKSKNIKQKEKISKNKKLTKNQKNEDRLIPHPSQYSEYYETQQQGIKNHLHSLIHNLHKKYKEQASSIPNFKSVH